MFHMGLISLWVMDKFSALLCSLLIQCMHILAASSTEPDGDGQLAHEAVERLFNSWSDFVDLIPSSSTDQSFSQRHNIPKDCGSDDTSPLPLTTGEVQNADQLAEQIKSLLRMLRSSNSVRQSQLFQIFLASKMAQPVGLRRISANDDNEEINLELDEDDMTASEDSLFTAGSCGLANAEESVTALVRLLNERVTQLVHLQNCEFDASVNLFEDLHWLLLITGHVLVSGPASLTSVLRIGCPWDTQFSIPYQILYLGSNDTVDTAKSRRLILLSVSQTPDLGVNWSPENLSYNHIPPLVILLCSLFRLLWLQVAYAVGSAQLVADNFWLVTRLAATYFCHNVVDRDTLMSNISRSPILTILQADSTQPPPAHQALDKWSHEPQVLIGLTRLLSVLSVHSPNPSSNLACSAWYDICTIVCGPRASEHAWPNLPTDSLIQLVEAVYVQHQTHQETDTLLLQMLREIREHVLHVINNVSGDGVSFGSPQNALAIDVLVNCTSVLRGVARAIGSFASNSEAVTDLISLVWNGLLGPFLSHGASYLVLKCHSYTEAVQALFSLFSDVADSCLIYLASLPSSSLDDSTSAHSSQVDKNVNGSTAVYASSSFLNWIVILCKHYTKNNEGKVNCEATAEDDHIQELRLLLNLLNRVLYHEFELRLSGAIVMSREGDELVIQPDSINSQEAANSTIPTVDAAVIGLGHLLPLITESILTIPELCQAFYSLASYACELRAQGFIRLTDHQLSCFGRLLRFGIFGLNIGPADQVKSSSTGESSSCAVGCVDNSVIQQCLDIVISLTDYFLEVRSRSQSGNTEELQNAVRLISVIGLETQFLSDLFTLLTRESYSVSLEASFSSALLNLIHLNPTAYLQLIHQWINECGNPVIQTRLNDAFEHLGSSYNEERQRSMQSTDHTFTKYTACFHENKPTRSARSEFQQRFHLFVAEMRSFICFV
ncbi:unnamed protein product [Heterobilharzia americana]|nr:unnamed protein product [Heterobilharzia americana]